MGAVTWCLAILLALSAGAGTAQEPACRPPQKPMLDIELFFGRNVGGTLGVTDKLWSQFLAREVTPRFPDGLTVIDAAGQWRRADGHIVRERSKVLRILVPADAVIASKIDAVIDAYKRRFRQQSVGLVTRPACASF
jgi:Protein of unknown function (DUF3574)